MELNFYIDGTTLSDLTSGGARDPFRIFKIGEEVEIEPVITTQIDKVDTLRDALPSIVPLNNNGLYRVVAKILGGYSTAVETPTDWRKAQCKGSEKVCWETAHLVVDFGVLSRVVINFPVRCRVCRLSEESFVQVPIEEKLTGEIKFERGRYAVITGRLSPVFLDFWEGAVMVRPLRGIIREFRMLTDEEGVLTVEVTGKGTSVKPGKGYIAFSDFAYDGYYSGFSPRIDRNSDSFTVRFSKDTLE